MNPTLDKVDEEEEIGGRMDKTDLSLEPEEENKIEEVKVEIAEQTPVEKSLDSEQ